MDRGQIEQLIERMIGAARLDPKLYETVEADESATRQAMIVVVLVSLAAGIGSLRAGFLGVVMMLLMSLLGWVVWAGITYWVGTKLLPEPQTEADLGELLRTTGFAYTPGLLRLLGIIPVLGVLFSVLGTLWTLLAMVIAVRQALDYRSTWRALGVCLIGFAVYMMMWILVAISVGLAGAVGSSLFG